MFTRFQRIIVTLIVALFTIGLFATGSGQARDREHFVDSVDERLALAIEYIFQEDYPAADSVCTSLINDFPGQPAGYFMKGIMYWKQGYYLKNYDDFNDSTLFWLKKAIDLAKDNVEKDPNDARSYFFGGGAYGYEGSVYARRKKWLKTGYSAFRGIRYLERSMELDSSLYDIYYGSGLYHVLASHQPGVIRWIQKLLPIPSGDAALGIQYLQVAAQKGKFTSLAALAGLSMAYVYYEDRYDDAINMLEPLVLRYPRNLDFLSTLINAYFYKGLTDGTTNWDRMVDLVHRTRRYVMRKNYEFDEWWLDKFDFMEGYAYYVKGRYSRAEALLSRYCEKYSGKGESYLTGLGYLTLGKMADLKGDRKLAVSYYKKVRKYETMGNEREIAAQLLDRPFVGEASVFRFVGAYAELPDRP